jgi:ISXO2 transposase-like protein
MSILDLLNSDNFNLFTFGAMINDEEKAIEAAYDLDLIPPEAHCPQCALPMTEEARESYKLGFRWRCCKRTCPGYPVIVSPLKNTFFEEVKLPFLTVFKLLVCWHFRMPVTQAVIHCEVDFKTAVDFYSFCREVCRVVHTHDEREIGGPGDVVEVDESHLFTPKYHRGRRLRRALWVFGGISRLTKKRFAVQITDKRKSTLWPLMQEHIAQGSYIMSDEHRSYVGCTQMNFAGHAAVNHSQTFVRPLPALLHTVNPQLGRVYPGPGITRVKVHDNTLERTWQTLKNGYLRRCRSVQMVPNYIGEFLYRTNTLSQYPKHRRNEGRKFLHFLRDLRRVYPGCDEQGISIGNCACGSHP